MTLSAITHPAVTRFRDYARGFIARTARASGWPDAQAVAIALKADEIATANILNGQSPHDAIAVAMAEADAIITLDTFERLLDARPGDEDGALETLLVYKVRNKEDRVEAQRLQDIAREAFRNARKSGLAPQAALICALQANKAFERFKASKKTRMAA